MEYNIERINHAGYKKVTLELVYEVVDERTTKILERIERLEKKQEEDFRYFLINKVDDVRTELRGEMGQLRTEMRTEMGMLNQRFDSVIQLIMSIKQHDR